MRRQTRLQISVICLLGFAAAASAEELTCARVIGDSDREEKIRALAKEGRLIAVLRHARDDGTTRRTDCEKDSRGELGELGEPQADKLGRLLKWLGVTEARVEASRTCRTVETAERLSFGAVNRSDELYEKSCDVLVRDREKILIRIADVSCASGNSVLVTHSGCMRVVLKTRTDLSALQHNGILAFFSKTEPTVAIGCAWPSDWDSIEKRMKSGVGASPNPIGRADG